MDVRHPRRRGEEVLVALLAAVRLPLVVDRVLVAQQPRPRRVALPAEGAHVLERVLRAGGGPGDLDLDFGRHHLTVILLVVNVFSEVVVDVVRLRYVTVGAPVVVRNDVCVVLYGLCPGNERELVLDANGLDHADAERVSDRVAGVDPTKRGG